MFTLSNIRLLRPFDLPKLKVVLDQIELFPSDMLDDMVSPFLDDSSCTDLWNVCEHDGEAIALLYCVQEKMTQGTWNVLALGVAPGFQSQGIGELLMSNIEQTLIQQDQSTLLVETSSLPEFERTRRFYRRIGYHQEAIIRDFYEPGDDKVVFWKSLSAQGGGK